MGCTCFSLPHTASLHSLKLIGTKIMPSIRFRRSK
jgi:hypothetical protein